MLEKLKTYCKRNNCNLVIYTIKFILNYIMYGCSISEYFGYGLFNKTKKEKLTYVLHNKIMKFYRIVNPDNKDNFFKNKPEFLLKYKDYIGREFFFPSMDIKVLKKLCNTNEKLFVKPIDGCGGKGIYTISTKQIIDIKHFYNELLENNLYVEEPLIQCKLLNEIYDSSINTIRIITFKHDSNIEIIFSALRIGNGKNVDNLSSGGMVLKVNEKTGKCNNIAYDRMGNEYKYHPISMKKFNNIIIPNWDNVKLLVKNIAKTIDYPKFIGWDVAITESGPVIIEGNRQPGFDVIQFACNCGRKDIIDYVSSKL